MEHFGFAEERLHPDRPLSDGSPARLCLVVAPDAFDILLVERPLNCAPSVARSAAGLHRAGVNVDTLRRMHSDVPFRLSHPDTAAAHDQRSTCVINEFQRRQMTC